MRSRQLCLGVRLRDVFELPAWPLRSRNGGSGVNILFVVRRGFVLRRECHVLFQLRRWFISAIHGLHRVHDRVWYRILFDDGGSVNVGRLHLLFSRQLSNGGGNDVLLGL